MTDVTRIINAIEDGEAGAAEELLPLVYDELRVLFGKRARLGPGGVHQGRVLKTRTSIGSTI